MQESNDTVRGVEFLQEIESTIGRMYRVFAEKFPAQRDLWLQIAEEEDLHAQWAQTLADDASRGAIKLKRSRLDVGSIQLFRVHARNLLYRAENEELSVSQAMDMALDLETSLLERRFYDIFDGDSEALRKVFSDMRAQTQDHLGKLRALTEASRGQG